jgi:hypothetical protein
VISLLRRRSLSLYWPWGEWCLNAGDAPGTATRVDRTNAREAANFLKHHTDRDLYHIRACLLIAFYCGLCGDVRGSKRYVHKAAELLKQGLSPESLRGTITSENSFRVAFWICIALERYGKPLVSHNLLLTHAVRLTIAVRPVSNSYVREFSGRASSTYHIQYDVVFPYLES